MELNELFDPSLPYPYAVQLSMKMKELKRSKMIYKEDVILLEKIEKELNHLQSSCWHVFEKVALFTSVRFICKKCDKEELNPACYRIE